ncbi:MAG: hypothetical protein HYV28_01040 [Ignavibacteriales bacterium]|nr:hypothetical protein [Ignavibacteriales bacterium]
MKLILKIFIISFFLTCCVNTITCGNSVIKYENLTQNIDPTQAAEITALDFMKWYKKNYDSIIAIEMVNNLPNTKNYDSTKFYSVNFAGTEKYLNYLKSSGYVSDKYLDYWRANFKKSENNFKKHPVNDGIVEGFEYDFVLLTQEIEDALRMIETAKVVKGKIQNGKAEVHLKLDKSWIYNYKLSFNGKKWLIDSIGYYRPNSK